MTHKDLEQKLAGAWPPVAWCDLTVLVAVSGGADSVALVRALTAIRVAGAGRLVVAHFHHHLRGADADADLEFVVELAVSLGLPHVVGHGTVSAQAAADGQGFEAAARTQRYDFLERSASAWGARYVATAHTADDQAETILHRIVRGTGLAGLGGMRRARALGPATTLIRPLLEFRRAELTGYLEQLGQKWRIDSSNFDLDQTRGHLRNCLIPLIADRHNPRVVEAIVRLSGLAAEAHSIVSDLAARLAERTVRRLDSDTIAVDCRPLSVEARLVVREMLVGIWREQGWPEQDMGLPEWQAMADLALAPATSLSASGPLCRTFPGRIHARRHGDELRLGEK